jgi:hypothetical protein
MIPWRKRYSKTSEYRQSNKEEDKKDMYALAKKLLRLGLIEPPQKR